LPDGFKIKTATVIHKADGWYVTLSLQDYTVPVLSPEIDFTKVVGIDVGLKDFLVTSDEDVVSIPQFARKTERRRKLLNKLLNRKKRKGTKRRQKAGKRLSKHYLHVARQRKDFHYNIAKRLLHNYDVIAHEDRRSCWRSPPAGKRRRIPRLNIKRLAKTHLSKSILDAGWGNFIAIVTCKAENAGKMTATNLTRDTLQRQGSSHC